MLAISMKIAVLSNVTDITDSAVSSGSAITVVDDRLNG